MGNAVDYRTAFRNGAFNEVLKPWLGYLLLLEDADASRRSVGVEEPHFRVFPQFRGASYTKRCELLCTRMVRDGLYDAACLLVSTREKGLRGAYGEPCAEAGFAHFMASLTAHVTTHLKAMS